MKTEYYDCACSSPDHTIRFTYFDEEEYDDDRNTQYLGLPEIYLDVQLVKTNNIFKRAWKALKYVFGYECRYGHWDTWMLKEEDADKMIDMLNRFKLRIYTYKNKQKT